VRAVIPLLLLLFLPAQALASAERPTQLELAVASSSLSPERTRVFRQYQAKGYGIMGGGVASALGAPLFITLGVRGLRYAAGSSGDAAGRGLSFELGGALLVTGILQTVGGVFLMAFGSKFLRESPTPSSIFSAGYLKYLRLRRSGAVLTGSGAGLLFGSTITGLVLYLGGLVSGPLAGLLLGGVALLGGAGLVSGVALSRRASGLKADLPWQEYQPKSPFAAAPGLFVITF